MITQRLSSNNCPSKGKSKLDGGFGALVNFSVHYESDVVLGFGQILAHKLAHAER